MKETNHSHSFNASDISRYINREMSPAEMHAIEKAALDDPFLADAIEGYGELRASGNEIFISPALEELRRRLEKRTREQRKGRVWYADSWLRVAAAFILIAGTAGVVFIFVSNSADRKEQLAKNETVKVQPPDNNKSIAADSSEPVAAAPAASNLASTPARTGSTDLKTLKARNSTRKDLRETVADASTPAVAAASPEKQEAKLQERDEQVTARSASAPPAASPQRENAVDPAMAKNRQLSSFPGKQYSGRVVDTENKPIAGASVTLENKSLGVTTDEDGKFNLSAPDSTVKVHIASVGYEPAKITLRNNLTDNHIVLMPAETALNEVVVTGYGTQRRKTGSGRAAVPAEPAPGWTAYEQYLAKNTKTSIKDSGLHGVVIISFLLNKKGKPTDIKVEQSLTRSLDAEAIRLLKNGPSWKPVNGKTRNTINIRF